MESLLTHVAKRKIAMFASLLRLFITLILLTHQNLQLLREKSKLGIFQNCYKSGKSRIENSHLRVPMNIYKFTSSFKPLQEHNSYNYLPSTKMMKQETQILNCCACFSCFFLKLVTSVKALTQNFRGIFKAAELWLLSY